MTSASGREFCPQRYDTEARFTMFLIMIKSQYGNMKANKPNISYFPLKLL